MSVQDLDAIIKDQAIQFADQIRQAAEFAEKEEEIRIEAERALAVIQREAKITLHGRHEYTIGTGRIDSVYGCVIVEYKNPHSPSARLSDKKESKGNQEVIKQIKERFLEFKKEQNRPMNTMFGVGCDGHYFIFIRYRDGKWYVEDPVEVNRYSAERFLWALINMGEKGKAFSPEYLAGDFGSDSPLAKEGVRYLYDAISSAESPKAQAFFQQWKILFGEVCGYEVDMPSDKIRKLAEFYEIEGSPKPAELLFSLHTYYAVFMKLLASEIVAFFHKLPTPLQKILKAPTANKLKDEMKDLEQGSIFRHLNITNFLEGDLFAWYVDEWNDSIEKLIRDMANKLDGYNPGTLSEDPSGSRDLLKKLYQQLFPRDVRHDLGEYYTPDWLAEHVLNELEYVGDPDKRLLDPACGSGTFLVMAINRIRRWYDERRELCGYDEGDLARKILDNLVGFDLNPLAVMAARTNYLIAMRDLLGRVGSAEIPVYLCDSIMTPAEYGGIDAWTTGERIKTKELKTSVANFKIPLEVARDRRDIAKYAEQLEFCIRNGYEPNEFIQRCLDEGLKITAEDFHTELYQDLVGLDKANKNGVWARIIKNSFAPLFCGRFDYIAGNPPWINWKSLPENYRNAMKPLWRYYNLFSLNGLEAQYGGSEKDISLLFICIGLEKYLTTKGRLGYVITQTIFQTKGASDGFRNCCLKDGEDNHKFKIIKVSDMVDVKPFEGTANRTATVVVENNEEMVYPVPYNVWTKKKGKRIVDNIEYSKMKEYVNIENKLARPLGKLSSPWLVTSVNSSFDPKKISGKSPYQAIAGSCTWLDGVFSINILKDLSETMVMVQNNVSAGKIKVPQITGSIEKDMIYVSIRGRDIKKWQWSGSDYILAPQDPKLRCGYRESFMKQKVPKTYEYLLQFKDKLLTRSGYKKYFSRSGCPFYSIYNIGENTFKPYKVAWRYIAKNFECCVIGYLTDPILGDKPVIPDNKVMFVPLDDEDEAYYLCGMLNSSFIREYIEGFTIETQISTYVLEHVSVPLYRSNDSRHKKISELSKECHRLASEGDLISINDIETQIDEISREIWHL